MSGQYLAGRITGMRDAEDGKPVRDTRTKHGDFRKGYSDGYHAKSGGLRF